MPLPEISINSWSVPVVGLLICLGIFFFPKLRRAVARMQEKKKGVCSHHGAKTQLFTHILCADGNHRTAVSIALCRACGEAVPSNDNLKLVNGKWLRSLRAEVTARNFGLTYIPDPDAPSTTESA